MRGLNVHRRVHCLNTVCREMSLSYGWYVAPPLLCGCFCGSCLDISQMWYPLSGLLDERYAATKDLERNTLRTFLLYRIPKPKYQNRVPFTAFFAAAPSTHYVPRLKESALLVFRAGISRRRTLKHAASESCKVQQRTWNLPIKMKMPRATRLCANHPTP